VDVGFQGKSIIARPSDLTWIGDFRRNERVPACQDRTVDEPHRSSFGRVTSAAAGRGLWTGRSCRGSSP
jgi:hypothetical protein